MDLIKKETDTLDYNVDNDFSDEEPDLSTLYEEDDYYNIFGEEYEREKYIITSENQDVPIPDDIDVLIIYQTTLITIPTTLPLIKKLIVFDNSFLKNISGVMPMTLESLIIQNNPNLNFFDAVLPQGLQILDVRDNENLQNLPTVLPDSIVIMKIENTQIKSLPNPLPSSLGYLSINSFIDYIPPYYGVFVIPPKSYIGVPIQHLDGSFGETPNIISQEKQENVEELKQSGGVRQKTKKNKKKSKKHNRKTKKTNKNKKSKSRPAKST